MGTKICRASGVDDKASTDIEVNRGNFNFKHVKLL